MVVRRITQYNLCVISPLTGVEFTALFTFILRVHISAVCGHCHAFNIA